MYIQPTKMMQSNSFETALYCNSYLDLFFNSSPKSNTLGESIMFTQNKLEKFKLYCYHCEHPNIEILNEIFSDKDLWFSFGIQNLCSAYARIINENCLDIVSDIIRQEKSFDHSAIMAAAIHTKRHDIIQELIDNGFSLNNPILFCNYDYISDTFCLDALSCAVYENDLELCKFLVENGADCFNIALFVACQTGDACILSYFLELMYSVNIHDSYLVSVIMKCNNNIDKIKLILNGQLDINSIDKKNLGLLISNSNIVTLEFLVLHGLELQPEFIDSVCLSNNIELCKYLLQKGFKPSIKTINNVFSNVKMDMIKLFLDHNVNLSGLPTSAEYTDLILKLETNGLSKDDFIYYLIKKYDEILAGKWFDSSMCNY